MTLDPGSPEKNVARDETNHLIASDTVEGTSVYDRSGENIGTVYDFMLDNKSGHGAYAVMSYGGFLGIGEKYHPIPWKKLTYDTGLGGYIVDIDRKQLESAPSYSRSDSPWRDPKYGRSVYDYYGVPYG